jgi:P27 family predicted phage terminase small subunit
MQFYQKGKKVALSIVEGGDGMPKEPDWQGFLSDDLDLEFVRNQWRSITNTMRDASTISVANGHAIMRLVYARLEFDRAMRMVAEHGAVRKIKGVQRKSPAWALVKQANEICVSLESELCLSPAKRGRAGKVDRKSRKTSPADEFLKPVK